MWKVNVYIKTTPSSMGYLTKISLPCWKCREITLKEDKYVPVCQNGGKCRVAEYISKRLPNVEYKIANESMPEITISTQNINEIERAYTIANRAIRLARHQLYR